jgi:hypothetical protein
MITSLMKRVLVVGWVVDGDRQRFSFDSRILQQKTATYEILIFLVGACDAYGVCRCGGKLM